MIGLLGTNPGLCPSDCGPTCGLLHSGRKEKRAAEAGVIATATRGWRASPSTGVLSRVCSLPAGAVRPLCVHRVRNSCYRAVTIVHSPLHEIAGHSCPGVASRERSLRVDVSLVMKGSGVRVPASAFGDLQGFRGRGRARGSRLRPFCVHLARCSGNARSREGRGGRFVRPQASGASVSFVAMFVDDEFPMTLCGRCRAEVLEVERQYRQRVPFGERHDRGIGVSEREIGELTIDRHGSLQQ